MAIFISLFNTFLSILLLAIFVRSILSWFPIARDNPLSVAIVQLTEPVLSPIRKVLPRIGSLDLSPMVAMLLIILLRAFLAASIGR
jgi:YggT family protein